MLVSDAFVLERRRRTVAMKPDVMLPRHLAKFLVVRHCWSSFVLQIASPVLLFLERLEERFEIALTETLGAFALNDLEKERRSILNRLGEDLEQITLVVAIDQNAESLQRLQVFVDVTDTSGQLIVIRGWNIQELDAALLNLGHCFDDILGRDRHVLHAFAVVKVEILFHLRFLFAFGRLIDRK